MTKKIMVIGGYGQVGSYVCENLQKQNLDMIVAGRSLEKCKEYVNATMSGAECRKVDVTKWTDSYLDGVETVVMCLEMNNMTVLEACMRCKTNYVDITPSGSLIEQFKRKKNEIAKAGIAVCVGVGIAPGVSNVLCEAMAKKFDKIDTIDSYIMLGVGESHGKNAVSWLVNNLNVTYYENSDRNRRVKSFSDGRSILLKGEKKKRRFVRIDMADWHIMKEKHKDAFVNSWYAYDKNIITILFEGMQKIGLLNILKYPKVKAAYTKMMESSMKLMKLLHFGTNQYAVMVEVKGTIKGKAAIKRDIITGRENSVITGRVCALTAQKMGNMAPGFYYMDELLERTQIV